MDVSEMTRSALTSPARRCRSAPVPLRMSMPMGVHHLGGTPHAGSGCDVYAAGSSTPSLARLTIELEDRTQCRSTNTCRRAEEGSRPAGAAVTVTMPAIAMSTSARAALEKRHSSSLRGLRCVDSSRRSLLSAASGCVLLLSEGCCSSREPRERSRESPSAPPSSITTYGEADRSQDILTLKLQMRRTNNQ